MITQLKKHALSFKSGDWLILILSMLLIPLSWSIVHTPGDKVSAIEVTVGNQTPAVYSIETNRKINIQGTLGESIIEIENHRVRISHSVCDGKICIISGWHQHSGDNIVCLPNKVAVSLISQSERFDGINY